MRALPDPRPQAQPTTTTSVGVAPSGKVVIPTTVQVDPLVAAVKALPQALANVFSTLPAPVMAPRPQGSWLIRVDRDKDGRMNQMRADFHETFTPPTNQDHA